MAGGNIATGGGNCLVGKQEGCFEDEGEQVQLNLEDEKFMLGEDKRIEES